MVDQWHQEDADRLKDKGNKLYKEGKYADAVEAYGSAIIRNPDNQGYYQNRAMAYYKLGQFELTISDCQNALEKGAENFKAYYYGGLAQTELGQLTSAAQNLKKAYDMAIATHSPSAADICNGILTCRRKSWELDEKRRKARAAPLMNDIEEMYRLKYEHNAYQARQSMSGSELNDEVNYLHSQYNEKIQDLETVFQHAGRYRPQEEAPDYLIDPITFELFVDPVITPSGNSYERAFIMAHLKSSKTDPLTRGPLHERDLRPNRQVQQAADDWRVKHGTT